MHPSLFYGCVPALMTPCHADRTPNYDALVRKGKELVSKGMSGVVYCGSMGDWPLLSDEQRKEGVARLVDAGVPTMVGTGAINTAAAVSIAAHAAEVGATGLMVIPRVLSRGTSAVAQRAHFSAILDAANGLPCVIYNSPYYGFATRADLFFDLRRDFPNLIGFKEFGGADDLRYAGENITSQADDILLMVGVDTEVYNGYLNSGAQGTVTGIGNALPDEVLHLISLCKKAAAGDAVARVKAKELSDALHVLSTFDEGPDLVLFYKHLMVLNGEQDYALHLNESDRLSDSQRNYVEAQYRLFRAWYAQWNGETPVLARSA
ncbi:MAG: dihydrodipicolinate synthase family protein [Hyphomicrobiales bacterium]|jgi:1-pyrroline-4-hydroxy-2-carboxylate deaminase